MKKSSFDFLRLGSRIIACLLLLGISWWAWSLCYMPEIFPHEGDGVFENISKRAWPFAMPGYDISMPEFDLGKPFQAEYRISKLSTSVGRHCGLYLAVPQAMESHGNSEKSTATVTITMKNSKGEVIVRVAGNLNEFTWFGNLGTRWPKFCGLYQLRASFFNPDPNQEYHITIDYTPDPKLDGVFGFVCLECRRGK